jgi:outer membrane receptor protein involved in Fe transport
MPEYKLLPVEMDGRQRKAFFEVMPKIAVMYATGVGNLYATVAQGYKTGGYNTQIFSDILQNRMMNRMMSDLGVYFSGYEPGYDVESAISYQPEYSWNYEAGGHFRLLNGKLFVDAALFYMDCRNQQITVFPPGKSTGRLMSNAGRTRSSGAELSANYRYRNLHLTGNYGYTHATFIVFDNGNDNYSGKRVPYAPVHTVSASCEYRVDLSRKWIDRILFNVGWQGVGKIYWNENNTLSQPFYSLPDAYAALKKGSVTMGLWGKNLTETHYATFYFKSVGNSFVQRGKPLQMGVFLTINL